MVVVVVMIAVLVFLVLVIVLLVVLVLAAAVVAVIVWLCGCVVVAVAVVVLSWWRCRDGDVVVLWSSCVAVLSSFSYCNYILRDISQLFMFLDPCKAAVFPAVEVMF